MPPAARPASSALLTPDVIPEGWSNSGGFYEEMMAEFNPNPTMGENAWTMATSESNKVSLIKDKNVNRFAFWKEEERKK